MSRRRRIPGRPAHAVPAVPASTSARWRQRFAARIGAPPPGMSVDAWVAAIEAGVPALSAALWQYQALLGQQHPVVRCLEGARAKARNVVHAVRAETMVDPERRVA